MAKITFSGRVIGANTNMKGPLNVRADPQLIGPAFIASITIVDSVVKAECDVPDYKDSDLMDVLLQVRHLVTSVVDILIFSSCTALTVILERVRVDEKQGPIKIMGPPEIHGLCTAIESSNQLPVALELILSEQHLALTLRDLVSAIMDNNNSLVSCARAVEGIRHMVADEGLSIVDAWGQMRARLNLDRTYIQPVTSHSVDHRHGKKDYITPEIYRDVMVRSWTIMNRFLEYRKRGNQTLPLTDFPVLKG